MRNTEDILREELPAPLKEWALSQVNKNWEGWRDECFSLQKAIICFAEWHKTKEGWRYWYDVAFNDLHKHPDVVAYREKVKDNLTDNTAYYKSLFNDSDVVRKTHTKQEKDVQMEGKQEKQFPYKAMWEDDEVEVIAEHREWAFCLIKDPQECLAVRIENLKPLPEKPLTFGEWCKENKFSAIRASAAFFDDSLQKEMNNAYNQYQDYLKTFEG